MHMVNAFVLFDYFDCIRCCIRSLLGGLTWVQAILDAAMLPESTHSTLPHAHQCKEG